MSLYHAFEIVVIALAVAASLGFVFRRPLRRWLGRLHGQPAIARSGGCPSCDDCGSCAPPAAPPSEKTIAIVRR